MSSRKRVMIIGQPGSGKSTLARHLGKILDLPVVHIDLIHWQPGWVERSGAEKDRLCAEVHASDTWIFEGGRSVGWPVRLDRADTLIWLDFPLVVRSWRVFRRTLEHHGQSRPDLPEDCPERFNWEFIHWIWSSRKSSREAMRKLYESAPDSKETYCLRKASEVEKFLKNISK